MADRKKEVKEAQKKSESIIAQKFADTGAKTNGTSADDTKKDMYSMDYEAAKEKYGQGQGNNKYFMSKEQFDRTKADYEAAQPKEEPKVEAPKAETWQDRVKAGTASDEDMKSAYDAYKAGSYTPGPKTKEYFASNYETKSEEPTADNTLDAIEEIAASNPEVEKAVNEMTNPKTGAVYEKKANSAANAYEKALVELGAAEYDIDGNFVLKPTSKAKGWETWATMLSVTLSVIGLACGIPVMPVNFRAITGKDSRDAQIQALQQQYMNIKAASAQSVDQMNADVESGEIAQNNKDALEAQEKHAQATAATKDVIGAQTEASKDLIDAQAQADLKKAQQQIEANTNILALEQKHAKEMAILASNLNTDSALELTKFSKTGWLIDYIKTCKEEKLTNREIALAISALGGETPMNKGLQNATKIVNMVTEAAGAATDVAGTVMTGGANKVVGAAAGK